MRGACAESFVGTLWDDTVTLGDLSLTNQGIGAADLAIGFQGVDGILGSVYSCD